MMLIKYVDAAILGRGQTPAGSGACTELYLNVGSVVVSRGDVRVFDLSTAMFVWFGAF